MVVPLSETTVLPEAIYEPPAGELSYEFTGREVILVLSGSEKVERQVLAEILLDLWRTSGERPADLLHSVVPP